MVDIIYLETCQFRKDDTLVREDIQIAVHSIKVTVLFQHYPFNIFCEYYFKK